MNDIFVISDLHLGNGKSRDNFAVGNRPEQFNAFLDHVTENQGKLIILGDMFEFWQANLGRILVANCELLDRLADMEAIYVTGNHDVDLEPLIERSDFLSHPFFKTMRTAYDEEIQVKGETKKVRFLHGHETDVYNKAEDPEWGRMLTIFAGIFEDKNKSPILESGKTVEETLESFGEYMLRFWNWCMTKVNKIEKEGAVNPKDGLTPAQNPSRLKEHLKSMEELKNSGYDMLFVGHTHSEGAYPDLENPWYFNSGGWVMTDEKGKPKNTYLRITESNGVKVYLWDDNGGKDITALVNEKQ